jgi:hypothetical protein
MNKTVKTILCTICCVLALYGLIILIRKIMLAPEAERKTRQELGMKFFIEPYQYKGWFDLEDPNIIKERNTKCLQNMQMLTFILHSLILVSRWNAPFLPKFASFHPY